MRLPFVIFCVLLFSCGAPQQANTPDGAAKAPSQTRSVGRSGGAEASTANLRLGNYRALIIGVSEYDASHWSALPGARKDAQAIYDVLTKKYGFKKEHTTLLLNPTFGDTEEALETLELSVEADDLVFIYFAGHGSFVGDSADTAKTTCWVLRDSKTK